MSDPADQAALGRSAWAAGSQSQPLHDLVVFILIAGAFVALAYGLREMGAPIAKLEVAPVTLDPANLPAYAELTVRSSRPLPRGQGDAGSREPRYSRRPRLEILACEKAGYHGHTAQADDLELKGRRALRQAEFPLR
jgi:hypothetical protein